MPERTKGTRRTENVRVRGRAADVVARVMEATAHELSRVGYAALRVEDVAERSGVNKTTIYRRWPTKPELIVEAIRQQVFAVFGQRTDLIIDTGTLRGDLRASLLMSFGLSPLQLAILRVVQTERTVPEIDALTRQLRDAVLRMRLAMVQRGIARGELSKSSDAQLIVDLLSARVQMALLFDERIDADYVDRMLDLVLGAAAASPARATTSSRAKPGRARRSERLRTRG